MALVVAGLMAHGTTTISAIHHWKRGYDALEKKLTLLGAKIELCELHEPSHPLTNLGRADFKNESLV